MPAAAPSGEEGLRRDRVAQLPVGLARRALEALLEIAADPPAGCVRVDVARPSSPVASQQPRDHEAERRRSQHGHPGVLADQLHHRRLVLLRARWSSPSPPRRFAAASQPPAERQRARHAQQGLLLAPTPRARRCAGRRPSGRAPRPRAPSPAPRRDRRRIDTRSAGSAIGAAPGAEEHDRGECRRAQSPRRAPRRSAGGAARGRRSRRASDRSSRQGDDGAERPSMPPLCASSFDSATSRSMRCTIRD